MRSNTYTQTQPYGCRLAWKEDRRGAQARVRVDTRVELVEVGSPAPSPDRGAATKAANRVDTRAASRAATRAGATRTSAKYGKRNNN